ncbi:MAG: nitrous oxide reductase accessory protein NosL [Haloarculaceae archaeon]
MSTEAPTDDCRRERTTHGSHHRRREESRRDESRVTRRTSDRPAFRPGMQVGDARHGRHETSTPDGVLRRSVLAGGALLAASFAGCSGAPQSSEPPDPVTLSSGTQCDVCGMVVGDHPGPNGEIFYDSERPETHGNPARFDSLRGCLFPYYFQHERLDWGAVAVYVTDYSTVDYALSREDGRTFISSHTDAASFTDARSALYVVGSGVHGAMGEDLLPFSVRADADAFAADHGGDVLAFEEITPETLEG